ncbi:Acylphosphatase [Methanosarcina siciliae C2J]|uniref:acylphosphatase n=1 Tax=Methanosarcina siciliae C2J TaxID=1434118 RepID=A0A0E3PPK5_9EURY|nr:acylphosphatase [Methanosarcina siciliae]AKB37174.1 Acylphosphatase [Methanosarcina siciliae C2J]
MTTEETVRAKIFVSGRVQGVGFRRFARNAAERFGVDCNPKNLRDGRVFVLAEGRTESLELLINELRKGPIFAHVEDVDVTFEKALGNVYELS